MNCGTTLPEGANFCYNCGQRQIIPQQIHDNNNKFTYQDLVPYEYDEVKTIENHYDGKRYVFILFRKGEKVGISDEFYNKIYVPCQYKNIEIFRRGCQNYFKAFNGSKYFLYNNDRLIINGGADEILIDNNTCDIRPIVYRNFGRYGVITTWSPKLHEENYHNATIDTKNSVVITLKDGKYGLITYKGSILPNIFDKIEFEDREVQKQGTNHIYTTKTRCMVLVQNGKRYDYLKIYEKEINSSAQSSFSEGYYIKHMNLFINL